MLVGCIVVMLMFQVIRVTPALVSILRSGRCQIQVSRVYGSGGTSIICSRGTIDIYSRSTNVMIQLLLLHLLLTQIAIPECSIAKAWALIQHQSLLTIQFGL